MPLTLNADGKITTNPSAADIAHAFESLGKGTGFFNGPGISIIMLQRDEAHMLTATGTYAEGFFLGQNDGDPNFEYVTEMSHPISPHEIIRIIQTYARGEDWGRSNFKWEENDMRPSPTSKIVLRLVVFGFVAWLVYVLTKNILK